MKISIYGASSGQIPEKYLSAAAELGRLIGERGHTLVNGGGRRGMMAASAEACMTAGGEAIGVIPEFMIEQGWHHTGMSRLIHVSDMHTRKEHIAEISDACIALAGGVGTMEELLEVITWKQLGLYLKPIIILNTDGYFDSLIAQIRKAAAESFMRNVHMDCFFVATTPHEALHAAETLPLWDASIRKLAAL